MLEKTIARLATTGFEQSDRRQRDRGDVVAERPPEVLRDRAQRRARRKRTSCR
jgi:hypothetical protein